MQERYSCKMVDGFWINFTGRLDKKNVVTFCCEPIEDPPSLVLGENAADTLKELIDFRLRFINEGYILANADENGVEAERLYSKGCASCCHYQKQDKMADGRIHYVNFSMYPSPCQSKCIYCDVHNENQAINTPELKREYEKIFELLEYALRCGVIAPNATWQVSCGEISIHPYKERILELVKNQAVIFFTNCFKFDSAIAEILKTNPRSSINLSIDAGTAKTWHHIKGVNNFEEVALNLTRYSLASIDPKQVTLKYIVLPGVNDGKEDYEMLIEMMRILKITHLSISRDTRYKYSLSKEEIGQLATSTARLLVALHKNNFTHNISTYTPEELNMVVAVANGLLAR